MNGESPKNLPEYLKDTKVLQVIHYLHDFLYGAEALDRDKLDIEEEEIQHAVESVKIQNFTPAIQLLERIIARYDELIAYKEAKFSPTIGGERNPQYDPDPYEEAVVERLKESRKLVEVYLDETRKIASSHGNISYQ